MWVDSFAACHTHTITQPLQQLVEVSTERRNKSRQNMREKTLHLLFCYDLRACDGAVHVAQSAVARVVMLRALQVNKIQPYSSPAGTQEEKRSCRCQEPHLVLSRVKASCACANVATCRACVRVLHVL